MPHEPEENTSGGELESLGGGESSPDEEEVNEAELLDERERKLAVLARSQFSGPIPPPSILKGYKEIDPGLVDIIVRRWGAEQDHRHMQERKHLDAQIQMGKKGQGWASAVAIAALAAATLVGIYGGPIAGPAAASAMVGIIGAVMSGVYVYERLRRKKSASPAADDEQDE